MILKKRLSSRAIWTYVRGQVLLVLAWSVAVWLAYEWAGDGVFLLPFTPVGILGSAIAIFVAFRNNSAYARWWEAQSAWTGIVSASRVFGRLIVTFTDSHAHQPAYDAERSAAFKREMIDRQIEWVHALRRQLRGDWYAPDVDRQRVILLQQAMGARIYRAMADGTLGGFDSFQLEGQLAALTTHQGTVEKIKSTPLLRQYDYFTRLFVLFFGGCLPPGLMSLYSTDALIGWRWTVVPVSTLVAGIFIIMERTGNAVEDPFAEKVTDVPTEALCRLIERDLLSLAGESSLPPPLLPEKGYLS